MAGEQLAALIAQQPHLMLQAGLGAYQQANASRALGLQDRNSIIQAIMGGLGLASDIQQGNRALDIKEKQGNRSLDIEQSRADTANKLAGMDIKMQEALLKEFPPAAQAEIKRMLAEAEVKRAGAAATTAETGARMALSDEEWNKKTEAERLAILRAQIDQMQAGTEATRFGTEAGRLMLPGQLQAQKLGNRGAASDVRVAEGTEAARIALPGQAVAQGAQNLERGAVGLEGERLQLGLDQQYAGAEREAGLDFLQARIDNLGANTEATRGGLEIQRDANRREGRREQREAVDFVLRQEVVNGVRTAKTPEERMAALQKDPNFAGQYAITQAQLQAKVDAATAGAAGADIVETTMEVYNKDMETLRQQVTNLEARYTAGDGSVVPLASWGQQDRQAYEHLLGMMQVYEALRPELLNPQAGFYQRRTGPYSALNDALDAALSRLGQEPTQTQTTGGGPPPPR